MNLILSQVVTPSIGRRTEICEHKGPGHPDTLCDGAAEAVSQALCAAYLREYGEIRHHNVDKALLIGGQSQIRFGGGELITPIRLIIGGRADPLSAQHAVEGVAAAAAGEYLGRTVRYPKHLFSPEVAVRTGSEALRDSLRKGGCPVANDSSFGVGFAPYSALERAVLDLADLLTAKDFRQTFPAAGDDFKLLGRRVDQQIDVTIALAFIDRAVESVAHYFSQKAEMETWLSDRLERSCRVRVNTLDDRNARDENGIYLTVTGTSAEQGDDGQVGRGNRVSRLITPSRPMSLEAVAGKNPVCHVGKIYNVLAHEIANELAAASHGMADVTVQMLSDIGAPVNRPRLVAVSLAWPESVHEALTDAQVSLMVQARLDTIPALTARLAQGECQVF